MTKEVDPDERVSIGNLALVVLIIAIFHFGLTYVTFIAMQHARATLELAKVESAIGQPGDQTKQSEAQTEVEKQGFIETLLSFPIIYFSYKNPDGRWYYGLETPLGIRALNSLAAAMILQMVGMLAAQLLPDGHRWRRFLEGRSIHEKGGIPKELDRVPLFKAARWLEKLQTKRYGIAIVTAAFHFVLSAASNLLLLAEQVHPTGAIWPGAIFDPFHFPIATCFFSHEAWIRLPAQPAAILTAANSCFVGLGLQGLIDSKKWLAERNKNL